MPGEDVLRLRESLQAIEVRDEELRVQNEELAASQAAIEAAHLRYRELFDFAPDAYLVTDAAGVVCEANLAAEALLGHPRGRLAGKPLAALLAPGERAGFYDRLRALPHGSRADGWSFWLRTRKRGERLISASAARSASAPGAGRSIRWLLRDVTEQARADETARLAAQSQATLAAAQAGQLRLAAVLEETTDAFFSVDGEWRFTYVNRRSEEYWRTPRGEMLGRSIWELFPAMVGSESFQALQRAMRERRPVEYEAISRVTGRWIYGHAYPREEGLAVFFRDVTRRKRLEETRRYLDELSSALATSLDYAATLQSIARLATGALADCCLVHVEEAGRIRSPGVAHVDPDREAEIRELLRTISADPSGFTPVAHALRSGQPTLFERVDDEVLVAAAATPEQAEALRALQISTAMVVPMEARGRMVGAISFARLGGPRPAYTADDLELAVEIARRAALAADNGRLYQQARVAVRDRDDVLAIVSHDLRNPINAILLSATMLHEFAPAGLTERERRQVEVIRRSAEQTNALLQDLVEVASLEGGAPAVAPQRTEIAPLVTGVVEMFAPLAAHNSVHLECDPVDDVPPVHADYGRVLQVFNNLVGNAIKFTPPGGRIRLGCQPEGDALRFEVVDSGVGIAPEHLPHVFDRFWQARAAGRAGAGLGLAIARSIVLAHGGRIGVDSTPGAGSTFWFTLPLHRPAAEA